MLEIFSMICIIFHKCFPASLKFNDNVIKYEIEELCLI